MQVCRFSIVLAALVGSTGPMAGQTLDWPGSYTLYGTPGLLDMPTAGSDPDGRIAVTLGHFDGQLRGTITFQVTDRLSGSFRYGRNDDYVPEGSEDDPLFDRSFDLRYRLLDEGPLLPAVAVGLQDFLGTGVYSGEYLVATKTLTPQLRVTGGVGWGRFGSFNGIDNPFGLDDRPVYTVGDPGGDVNFEQLFRGDMAAFGGVEYRVTDGLSLIAEYSSDGYVTEIANGDFTHESPWNIGLSYRPRPNYELGLAYMYGSELALRGTITLDPTSRNSGTGLDSAPLPVFVRGADARAARTWDRGAIPDDRIVSAITTALAADGIAVRGVELSDRAVRVRYENTRYRSEAQAMGRVARVLTNAVPGSVETFRLEPVRRGIPLSQATLSRSEIERLENRPGAVEASLAAAGFGAPGPTAGLTDTGSFEGGFKWGLAPYGELGLFDGNDPVRGEIGIEATARYDATPNLTFAGAIRKSVVTSFDDPGSISDSTLPEVRRDRAVYAVEGDPGIEYLTMAWHGRLGADLYGRATVGYLERMYGGVSAELLWKPVDSRLALGAELNYAVKRDYDMLLGFQDYDVVTGHLSAYYDFGAGWHGQVDVGRYLAGDVGATVGLDREFENGWSVGGYFTLTDVSAEDFGEGSFDKGIRVTVPIDWVLGQPTRREVSATLTSLSRDGGARLNVDGRLYEVIRDGHEPALAEGWGRFWR